MSLLQTSGELWLPPPDMTISEWADANRFISPEANAEPGKWHTDRAPYQREMLDAVCSCERVIMMTSAQIGKTEILLNILGYYIDKEPSPILLLQPTLQMGESFSKERLAPMIRDTPCLSEKIADPRSRDSGNTLLHKKFRGGHIAIAGTNSPASLASRPIRILLCDEVDRYPVSAGTEGDPLSLATARTQNFWNRHIVWVSTPTMDRFSRIAEAYELSTQEEWEIPCPGCGEYQPYEWERISYKDKPLPVMECVKCHEEYPEREWKKGQKLGRWHAHADSATRGFHMNSFASPWVSWAELIRKYEEAYHGGDDKMKVWVNTVLGRTYENLAGTVDAELLMANTADYGAELPDGVLILTCGVDVQDDRLELEIVGWGLGKTSWGIEYRVLRGNPGTSGLWQQLDDTLQRTWSYADGREMGISCTMIDSAGHFTEDVYKFVKGKRTRNIFAIVGRGRFGMACVSKPSRNNRAKVPLYTLGVTTLKSMLYSRLNAERGEPGCCHFPQGRGYTELYFKGLVSEQMVMRRHNGQEYITWKQRDKKVRNEPLDCRVYATGALELLNPDLKAMQQRIERLQKGGIKKPVIPKRRRVGGFLRGGIEI